MIENKIGNNNNSDNLSKIKNMNQNEFNSSGNNSNSNNNLSLLSNIINSNAPICKNEDQNNINNINQSNNINFEVQNNNQEPGIRENKTENIEDEEEQIDFLSTIGPFGKKENENSGNIDVPGLSQLITGELNMKK